MSPFVKAACFALQDQPVVNAGTSTCIFGLWSLEFGSKLYISYAFLVHFHAVLGNFPYPTIPVVPFLLIML